VTFSAVIGKKCDVNDARVRRSYGMPNASPQRVMRTLEIPRRYWGDRLDEFSRAHEGWPVQLDILDDSLGAQSEFRLLSLAGVTSEPDGGGRISITATLSSGGYVTHTVHAPVRLLIEQTDAGTDEALAIEAADGTKAILHFTIAPAVNGLRRGRCG
jgi:hypothetical protein